MPERVKSRWVHGEDGGGRFTCLCASNGKPRGDRAVRVARQLAEAQGGSCLALMVLDQDADGDSADAALMSLEKQLLSGEGRCPSMAEVRPLHDYHTDEEHGRAAILADTARDRSADLVVIGPHDRGRGARPLSGTLLDNLFKLSGAPVLIAANEPPRPYKHVLLAADLSPLSFAALDLALRLAPDAKFTLLHVLEPSSGAPDPDGTGGAESLRNLAKAVLEGLGRMENPPSIEVRSQEGKAARLIRHVAEETEADLLVLGTRGQGRIARFFLGSTAHAFAENPPCDVLFLTPKAAAI